MAGKRVPVLDPEGRFATVDEADVANLPEGARVLTRQEQAERASDAAYAQKSTAEKATSLASVAGPLPFAARAAYKLASGHGDEVVPTLPPAVESYAQGVSSTFAGGVPTLAMRELARAGGGEQAAQKYTETTDLAKEANPTAHAAGSLAGVAGSIIAGGSKGGLGGLGKAIPGVGIGAAGGVLEEATVAALGGLAKRGALGRAAATGAGMAVRGALEGGALAGADQASQNMLHNTPVFGESLYAAVGHGALAGSVLGGVLGTAGSLAASGARGARSATSRLFSRGTEEAPLTLEGPRGRPVSSVDANAGLAERAPEAERPLEIGAERGREVGLRPNVYQRGGEVKASRSAIRRDVTEGPLFDMESGPTVRDTRLGINPDAGLGLASKAKAADEATDVFRFLREKPREVSLGETGGAVDVGAGPIRIGAPPSPVKGGVLGLLSNPKDGVRALAQEQAWKAVGAGFGLQTTRYAKEAAKYFENGTRDLGEIALRHGVIDISETATPLQAAWKAAKSGTPADMAPKIQTALDDVGSKIGDITDASGARVPVKQALAAVESVAKAYSGEAGRGPLVSATRNYGEELANVLRPGRDGTVSVRDLLTQRKVLDDIVYEEAKTLDPRGRVKALREVRAKLEDVITSALDDASGKVKGELAGQYKALKKDYHGLRILSEAAEDSAARSAKGATLGLGEKIGLATSIAGGHFGAAPVLALGGKVIRERGNAAAAAYLMRAADTGSLESVVRRFNASVDKAASTALVEVPKGAQRAQPKASKKPEPAEGKAEVAATISRAQAIVKWIGEMRANPTKLASDLEDASTVVSRAAGETAASSYTAATLRAISFIASQIPAKERRDPLDPRSVPPLTHDEADRLVRATTYAVHPETVFVDFGRGRVTPEGIAAAQTFMPEAFADFQAKLQGHVEAHMMRGERLTQTQRLRIDKLLGYPAGADFKPAAIARLQGNLMNPPPEEAHPANGPTGHKPVDMKVQQTGFDAVEAHHAMR